jgi:hypothetical protein
MISWNDRRSSKPGMSADRKTYRVSDNVAVKSPDGKPLKGDSLKGARQAAKQNREAAATPSKAESRANARGLKAANEPKKVPVENISKVATRVFGMSTTKGRGKPAMVVPGSKKEAKLKAKLEWADAYDKKRDASFDARMKKMKG